MTAHDSYASILRLLVDEDNIFILGDAQAHSTRKMKNNRSAVEVMDQATAHFKEFLRKCVTNSGQKCTE